MKKKKVPLRTCIACKEIKTKDELIRIARTPENLVKVDFTGKVDGRGVYFCRNGECFEKAIERQTISKHLKQPVGDREIKHLKEEFLKDRRIEK